MRCEPKHVIAYVDLDPCQGAPAEKHRQQRHEQHAQNQHISEHSLKHFEQIDKVNSELLDIIANISHHNDIVSRRFMLTHVSCKVPTPKNHNPFLSLPFLRVGFEPNVYVFS